MLKAFRVKMEHKRMASAYSQLKQYALKVAVGKYKIKIVKEGLDYKRLKQSFLALFTYSKNRKTNSSNFKHLVNLRTTQQKNRAFQQWHKRYQKLSKIRSDKQHARILHDQRYMKKFLKTWIDRYNTSQKKKYLTSLAANYQTVHIRNRFFTYWMHCASKSMKN